MLERTVAASNPVGFERTERDEDDIQVAERMNSEPYSSEFAGQSILTNDLRKSIERQDPGGPVMESGQLPEEMNLVIRQVEQVPKSNEHDEEVVTLFPDEKLQHIKGSEEVPPATGD